jgi:hypothetical protein
LCMKVENLFHSFKNSISQSLYEIWKLLPSIQHFPFLILYEIWKFLYWPCSILDFPSINMSYILLQGSFLIVSENSMVYRQFLISIFQTLGSLFRKSFATGCPNSDSFITSLFFLCHGISRK